MKTFLEDLISRKNLENLGKIMSLNQENSKKSSKNLKSEEKILTLERKLLSLGR